MDNLLKIIPEKYQAPLLALIVLIPYITRAYHALANGGGLHGIWTAIMYGTNTTPEVKAAITNIAAAVDTINQEGASPMAAPAVETKTTPEIFINRAN
jgi:hypothetical protein